MGPGFRRDDFFWGGSFVEWMMRRLRYTKLALLLFGLGLVLGLVVVAGELPRWGRVASAIMALGLVLIPLGLFADGHGMALVRWLVASLSRGGRKPRRATPRGAASRRRKPARTPAHPARRRRSPSRNR